MKTKMKTKIQKEIKFYKDYGRRNFFGHHFSQLRFETKIGRAVNAVYCRLRYTEEELLQEAHYHYAESHKSLHGVKWSPAFGSMTIKELYKEAKKLQEEANRNYEQEMTS